MWDPAASLGVGTRERSVQVFTCAACLRPRRGVGREGQGLLCISCCTAPGIAAPGIASGLRLWVGGKPLSLPRLWKRRAGRGPADLLGNVQAKRGSPAGSAGDGAGLCRASGAASHLHVQGLSFLQVSYSFVRLLPSSRSRDFGKTELLPASLHGEGAACCTGGAGVGMIPTVPPHGRGASPGTAGAGVVEAVPRLGREDGADNLSSAPALGAAWVKGTVPPVPVPCLLSWDWARASTGAATWQRGAADVCLSVLAIPPAVTAGTELRSPCQGHRGMRGLRLHLPPPSRAGRRADLLELLQPEAWSLGCSGASFSSVASC